MAIIHILALMMGVLFLAYKAEEKIVDVLPAAVCILVLVLVALGYLGHFSWLDVIALGVLCGGGIGLARKGREEKKRIGEFFWKEIKEPGTVILLVTVLAVTFLVRDKTVTWWDDLNFWATDVKSLFYLDGFAGKYTNAAPEFGDYPPGTQMMKWWFLHFSPSVYREGLMFGGYYFMNLVFLAPLLGYLPGGRGVRRESHRHLAWMFPVMGAGLWILCGILLWSFPSVVESFYLDGTCADLTMSLIYGAFLVGVLDREGHKEFFYYGRLALYLMVLVLIKNAAFLWVGFGLLFFLVSQIANGRRGWKGLIVMASPVLSGGIWLLFCYLARRVAKSTGRVFSIASSGVSWMDYTEDLLRSFGEAFLRWPLHRFKTVMIDLTPLGMCLLVLLFFGILVGRKRVKTAVGIGCGLFLLGSGLLYYGILLLTHLTVFAQETQYLEPFSMVSSIGRYGAPFTIGSLYMAAYLFLRSSRSGYGGYLACILFVFFTADHQSAYRGLVGYRITQASFEAEKEKIMDEEAYRLLGSIEAAGLVRARVLYLKDGAEISWVQHPYLAYEASPVSVVSDYLDVRAGEWSEAGQIIEESHAGYLYVNPMGEAGEEYFRKRTEGGAFQYQQLYRIEKRGGEIYLIPEAVPDKGRGFQRAE